MALPSSQERLPVQPRVRGRLRIVAFLAVSGFILAWGPAIGSIVFPLLMALVIAWFLWRSDYESGRN
ncbi:hypothetical protein [Sinomonas sp.]|jgi:hypothetical protein|uniref:hypothetical protein n=1 Tax=Sinomonas sp. TaxID=1914986 RepID=UPI002FE38250